MRSRGMESKRKRKRKTRTERNRLAHHLISSVDDNCEKVQSKTHTKETSASTLFSLRSEKALPYTMEVKKLNGASITHGRLTRRVGLFANMQSSDLISREVNRGVKKKGKKIPQDLASVKTNIVNDIDGAGDSSSAKNISPHDSYADEQDIVLIGSPTLSQSKDEVSESNCNELKRNPSPSGSPLFAPASIGSAESSNTEEFLDPEIAESISKDLKCKMARMFPSRNIEMEMCSELQKLIKRSSQRIPGPKYFKDIPEKTFQNSIDTYEENGGRKILEKACESPPSSFTHHFPLALPRPACTTSQDGEAFLAQHAFQASPLTHNPCVSTQPQVSFQHSSHPISTIPTCEAGYTHIDRCNFMRRTGRSEMAKAKAMGVQRQKDQESDEESVNSFLLARYHSFLLSSRELHEFQNLHQRDTVVTEASRSENSAIDSATWKCNYRHCAWQSHHNHQHQQHLPSCFIQDQDSNFPASSSLSKYSSYKSTFKAPERHAPSNLDISRHRLKTALESASTRCQTRPSFPLRQDISKTSLPSDPDFRQFLFQNDHSVHCSCSGPSLGHMKSHQMDLQYQARDFLDELENEFNQTHGRISSERHSLLSDSALYGGRQEEPGLTSKGSSTH